MTSPPYEVLANDTTLLTFDGRVLELFGFGDAHRLHIWQEPRLEFGTGRKPRTEIVIERPGVHRHSFPYDPERLDALRAFAARLARGVAERPRL
ncbi:hypothetical protein OG920_05490 [Streptomyces europaeiscabiei]|uniref:hypothetical protein n=1 Tax=Streptomyces TaxID=1883 RepID=UPI000A371204|nr:MULTISPECIES: hypothetical protein [Streptomyces]MDX3612196.1 hypothetical protein [Streptomyces europaeiscabiei]MDX3630427.1 hypothetical protein [Streptomyces europaeiscabiei]MDX3648564.1 hypothetical protein [Streptomyces europaeiscabiei]WUD30921.1 hypothetical protein OG858_05565 [Streptomyces europaeiscabiei]